MRGITREALERMAIFFEGIFEIRNRWIFILYDIFYCNNWISQNNIKNLYKTKL